MNMGYANSNIIKHEKEARRNDDKDPYLCPICNSNIYVSKYGNDFVCMDKKCVLNQSDGGFRAGDLVRAIKGIMDIC